jgi:hypothetical protein
MIIKKENLMQKDFLAFSPYVLAYEHEFIVNSINQKLKVLGVGSAKVRCNGILSNFCISMSAVGGKFQDSEVTKQRICNNCKIARTKIDSNPDNKGTTIYYLDDYISTNEISNIDNLVSNIDQTNWKNFEYENIYFARSGFFNVAISNKLSNEKQLEENEMNELKNEIRNSLIVYTSVKNIDLKKNFSASYLYNSIYSTNNSIHNYFQKSNRKNYNIQLSFNRFESDKRVQINDDYFDYFQIAKDEKSSSRAKNLNFKIESFQSIGKHLEKLRNGSSEFIYSTKNTGKLFSSICNNFKKNCVTFLLPLSSEDEFFASSFIRQVATPRINQRDFIKQVLNEFRINTHTQLIIRMHPRSAPEKRNKMRSKEYHSTLELIKSYKLKNVFINVPEDKISIYEIAQEIDCVINYASTVGLEFLALGIPVIPVDSDVLDAYPFNLVQYSKKTDTSGLLETAKSLSWDIENIKASFEWLHYTFMIYELLLFRQSNKPIKKEFGIFDILKNSTYKLINSLNINKAEFLSKVISIQANNLTRNFMLDHKGLSLAAKIILNNQKNAINYTMEDNMNSQNEVTILEYIEYVKSLVHEFTKVFPDKTKLISNLEEFILKGSNQ